ncbi:MAG: phosphodiester glycosidase family protein [Clostridium sp.]|uniref:phosphodiester glycosidase family protein n=1 Tax=Clostridium sp. TaxID=1506 RepID=UPI003EE57EB5
MSDFSFKNNKQIEIIKEMVKTSSDRYEINGIELSKARFMWRKFQEAFQILSPGSYSIIQEAGNTFLKIDDTVLLGEAIEFQVIYVFDQESSQYIDDFPDVSILKEKYNELQRDFTNLNRLLKSNNITGDTLKMFYVLPELNEGEVWIRTKDGWRGTNVDDLDKIVQDLINKIETEIKPDLVLFIKTELAKAQVIIDGMLTHDYIDIPFLNKDIVQIYIDTVTKTVRECDNTKFEPLSAVGLKFIKEDGTTVTRCYFRGVYDKPTTLNIQDGVYWQTHTSVDGLTLIQPQKWKSQAFELSNGKMYFDRGNPILIQGELGTIVFKEYETLNQAKADSSLVSGDYVIVTGDTQTNDGGQGVYQLANGVFELRDFNRSFLGQKMDKQDTIEDLKKSTQYAVGDVVEVLGYSVKGDGKGFRVNISSKDEGTGIRLYNNLWANIIKGSEEYSVDPFVAGFEVLKSRANDTDYYLVKIPKTFKMQLGLAEDMLEKTERNIDFSLRKNTTISINAGLFDVNTGATKGVVIKDGVVLKRQSIQPTVGEELLCINSTGELSSVNSGTVDPDILVQSGVESAVQGWYPLIRDGKELPGRDPMNKLPRQVISRKNDGSYVIFTCDGRTEYDLGMSTQEVCSILLSEGVEFAYMLDSGGSTSTVANGVKLNKNIDNMTEDRKVANFLYFSKFDEYELQIFKVIKEISELKQNFNKRLIELSNIESGLLQLKPKTLKVPGVDIYDINLSRRAKIGYDSTNEFFFVDGFDGSYKNLLKFKNGEMYTFGKASSNFYGQLDLVVGNIENVTTSGIYRCGSSTTDKPNQVPTSDYGSVICMKHGTDSRNFIDVYFSKEREGKVFVRQRYSSGVGSWVELATIQNSVQLLDTPYHATQMSKLGILDSYHNYLTDLHEYEKQQKTQSDTGVMNLNVIQPPIIPTEVEEYAKEYNLL